jgi:putative ABC transport system permease protein
VAGINLSGIRYIYEARFEARAVLVQEVFAILGIAVGVALLFASQVASTSLTHSVTQLNSQLVGNVQVQLEARGPEGYDEGLLAKVRQIPPVQIALPVLEQQVDVIGPAGKRSVDLIGVDAHSLHTSGPLLRRFSAKQLAAQQAIALPSPLAAEIGVGPLVPVKLEIGARIVEALVGATLGEGDIGGLIHSAVALTPIGYAQRLVGGEGKLSRIFVRFDPARAKEAHSELARLAAEWNVNLVPGQFDSRLFAVAVAPENESETMFSAISALVGFMFALNAMLVTVPSRRRLIEDVRPHGATRWDTVKILLFDAAVIGVLACVLGLVLGDVLSIAVFHTTPGYLAFAFPVGNNRIVAWQSVAVAVAVGMGAAIIGVLWPVRQILARPLQPPPDSASHRQAWIAARLATGLMCLVVTTVILLSDPGAAVVGNITLLIALVCLLPFMFDGFVALFRRGSDLLDGVGSALAVTELQTQQTRVRSLAIAATAAVAVFGTVEFQGTQTNLTSGLDASAHDIDANASIWVSPGGESNAFATTAFTNSNLHALTHLPGVRNVGIYRGSFLNWGKRRLWILAPPGSAEHPVPPSQLVSGRPTVVEERVRSGNWAVLSQALAGEHHLHVGETFTLPSPRPMTMRVAGLSTNLGWAPGAMILSAGTYARAWASGNPSAYEIRTKVGTSPGALRDLIRHVLRLEPGLAIETATEREQRHYTLAAQGLSRLTQIRLLVLIAAILAVVGAMGAMIWQRRDLIAFIKCHGYEEGVLWRWLLCEAAVLLAVGCSIGALFGLYAQVLGSHFLSIATGFPVIYDLEGVAAISSFGLVTVIALAVVALPGYLVVRVRPNTSSPGY